MKKIIVTFFTSMMLALFSAAQDCDLLNNLNAYHGIKLGLPVPDSIKNNAEAFLGGKNGFNSYDLPQKKMEKFYNGADVFSEVLKYKDSKISLYTLKDFRTFQISLSRGLYGHDSISLHRGGVPESLDEMVNEVIKIFGQPTQKINDPSAFLEKVKVLWECKKIKLTIEVIINTTGLKYVPLYRLEVNITDVHLEKLAELNQMKSE